MAIVSKSLLKKTMLLAALSVTINFNIQAQNTSPAAAKPTDTAKLYNPLANAVADISKAVKQAAAEHKNVLLQVGGNWCIWCLRFNELVTKDAELNKYLNENFIVVHVNYSKENTNDKLLASLGYPQRFGFPVFVVLDNKGNRLHIQNSAYLEDGGKGHSKPKVLEFFQHWSPAAIDPRTYEKKQ